MEQRHELTWLDADIDGEPAVPAFDMQIEYQHYLQRLELVRVESQPMQMEREASTQSHRDTIACLAMTCLEGVMRDF